MMKLTVVVIVGQRGSMDWLQWDREAKLNQLVRVGQRD